MSSRTIFRSSVLATSLALALASFWVDRDLVRAISDAISSRESLHTQTLLWKIRFEDQGEDLDGSFEKAGFHYEWNRGFFAGAVKAELLAAVQSDEEEAWRRYTAKREAALPRFKTGVEDYLQSCQDLEARDPKNGIYRASAALARLELALWPSCEELAELEQARRVPVEPLKSRLKRAPRCEVLDPAALQRALDELEAALRYPELRFHNRGPERAAAVEAYGFGNLLKKLELALPKWPQRKRWLSTTGGRPFAGLSDTGHPETRRALSLGRRLYLRLASEGSDLRDLRASTDALVEIDQAWVGLAHRRGDNLGALAAREEITSLEDQRSRSEGLTDELSHLGSIDRMIMPRGGWNDFDQSLGRRVEHAIFESFLLWFFILAPACGLLLTVFLRSRPPEQRFSQGWTIGDTLSVVLPSWGLGIVLAILTTRLHPLRIHGFADVHHGLVLFIQSLAILLASSGLYNALLHRRLLDRHGLPTAIPGLRACLALIALTTYAATAWVGSQTLILGWLSIGAEFSAYLALFWVIKKSAESRPEAKLALKYNARRVNLFCLGVSGILASLLQLGLVAPRRLALTDAYTTQTMEILENEVDHWGDGRLRLLLTKLLQDRPDHPGEPR